jgi:hypothetical protein
VSHDLPTLQELYAGRALEPLDPFELEALDDLEATFGRSDDRSFEIAAAAVALAGVAESPEPLPRSLRQSLLEQAEAWVGPLDPPREIPPHRAPVAAPRWRRPASGWVAAAVCLVAAILGWSRTPGPATSPSPQTAREALLRSGANVLRLAWSATEDPLNGGATGDVVWSNQSQEGYMTFHHLPANDPARSQYQLWIFDTTREQDHPVDGGVFDVTGNGEAVVPIHAKLDVREPALFAVTLEPPGGVVVSDREHLLLVASATQ